MSISPTERKRLEAVKELTEIPSPTGNTYRIMDHIQQNLRSWGVNATITPKGGLLATLKGKNDDDHRYITAHVDTLGAMVRAIKPDGRLKISLIGGFTFNSIEGEYCTIHASRSNKCFTGTILMHQTSVHVYRNAGSLDRNQDNIEVRIDEVVTSAEETRALGIDVGDFISFDPRAEITETGFLKSRHLDDKVSVALLLEAIQKIQKGELKLAHTTHFYISNNEEIGYGGNSNIASRVREYLAVDMGAIGDDQQTDEYTVSICVQDASGPYHLGLRNHFVDLCERKDIPYQLDIYPYYMSDASGAMRAGADVRHGLIGAGIDASHAYERTHIRSINATADLIFAYLANPMA